MKEEIFKPKPSENDDYAHPDEEFRNIAPKEREPQNAPGGMCEQEIDPVGVTAKGKLKELFSDLPPEDDEALKKEVEKSIL